MGICVGEKCFFFHMVLCTAPGAGSSVQAGGPGASMPRYEAHRVAPEMFFGSSHLDGLSDTGGRFPDTTMCAGRAEGPPSATACSFGRAVPAELLARLTRWGMSVLQGDAETEPKMTRGEVFSLFQGRVKDKARFADSLCSCLMLLSLYSYLLSWTLQKYPLERPATSQNFPFVCAKMYKSCDIFPVYGLTRRKGQLMPRQKPSCMIRAGNSLRCPSQDQ